MAQLYASTFIAGAGEIIAQCLKTSLPSVQIERLDDGLALYRSKASIEMVQKLRFVQNSFLVLSHAETLDGSDPLKSLVKHVREDETMGSRLASSGTQGVTYKLQVSVANALTKLHPIQRQKLEKRMGDYGLVPAGAKPKRELWLLVRREGYGFLGLRLTHHEHYERPLQQGELKPDLADVLCVLSQPGATDIVLDPCAGHGGIVRERIKAFPYAKILMGDRQTTLVSGLRKEFSQSKQVVIGQWDASDLEGIPDASVDCIITDPPWGKFEQAMDLESLYPAMLAAFRRVLKHGGRAVILTSRDDLFENALRSTPGLRQSARYDILVSGQKARVWVLAA